MSDTQTPLAKPHKWSSFMVQLYGSRKPPVCGSLNPNTLEEIAREKCKDHLDAYMYIFGSAGTSSTHHANRKAFDRWRLVPRMLRDATERSLETTIFGVKYPSPLLIAPIGVQGIVCPEAELASAAAAARCNVPYIMSSASTRSLEAIAKASGNGPRWYQLYWPKSNDITLSLLGRAKANGYTALVVTLDTNILGWRPHDIDSAYLPFLNGVGIQNAVADPVFMARFNLQPIVDERPEFPYSPAKIEKLAADGDENAKRSCMLGRAWLAEANSGEFKVWDDVKFLLDNWDGPVVLKGIQTVADAEQALEIGCHGIVVSNHGGRQVDGAIPSLWALEQICSSPKIRQAQESGKFTVIFDSGLRTGSDGIKAMALGAQAIGLGRPYMHGLTIAGEAGAEEVIRSFLGDMEVTLGLIGCTSVSDIWYKKEEVMERSDV
ncbi:FMN-dependent alpha-hydroxy acid dehydrogenase [Gloeophyllum trabeum ATCC 11539]|uniref:FMN-dependent alpha-hydroxy acid dehydrogenase n=1 Tax=Gloeophyllum trabeum (strain ATCC 11539 / FP-39264 / Madison 617) TaxID=670483 RepID=S7Q5U2_GLOTA|nr:FMN-dependent alpha-hydroxy acid dehydrogenase [Gloeophyllum trabeum ATCC 11539]EPQ54842.1 FMN-dependent alpha-hydroxy acid dehydrogenase [Gloeophyllum trabeum ATCC 11539]